MKPHYIFNTFCLWLLTLTCLAAEEDPTLYNTSEVYDPQEIRPGFEMWADDEVITQPFFTGDADTITSVELDVRILKGSPTGRILIEVWDDDGNGEPNKKVGTFGSVLVDDLPAASKRPVVHTIVEGQVSDIEPQSHYHMVFDHSGVVFRPPLERDKVWYTTYGSEPDSTGAGRAKARGDFTGNQWKTLESILGGGEGAKRRFVVMKVVGTKSQPVLAEHTITLLTPSGQGVVTKSPDMETYPTGTEVSLTATPIEDYEFSRWLIGEEMFTENPLTLMIEADILITPEFVENEVETVLYDNIPDILPSFHDGNNGGPPGRAQLQPVHAQPFFTGSQGKISSVSVYMINLNGNGSVDMVLTDEKNGKPGEIIATLGTIELQSLVPWSAEVGEVVTFDNEVTGLEPNTRYFIGFHQKNQVNPAQTTTFYNLFVSDSEGTNDASVAVVGPFGAWKPMSDFVPGADYMMMRVIEGSQAVHTLTISSNQGAVAKSPDMETYPTGTEVSLTATPSEDYEFSKWLIGEEGFTENPLTLTITDDMQVEAVFERDYLVIDEPDNGSITFDPPRNFYPIGSDVTVTAVPVDGYEFVKWTYGDTEPTTNPATIRVMEGATLTPVFAMIEEPEPLQVDIEHAVAISWDSQADKVYQIHSSTDMETWEVAIESIQGTGERLMQCFIREETEVFYRVEEKL